jgi:hypothetical protein
MPSANFVWRKPVLRIDAVDDLAVFGQDRGDGVEIAIAPAPEVQVLRGSGSGEQARLAGRQRRIAAVETAHHAAVAVADLGAVADLARSRAGVADLGLRMDRRATGLHVEFVRPDILANSAKAGGERQRLVDRAGQVQPDILGDPAIIDVEIVVVPLEAAAGRALLVLPVIVDADRDEVLAGPERRGDIGTERHRAVLGERYRLAIDPDLRRLTHAFELEEGAGTGPLRGKRDVLAVPDDAGREILDVTRECLLLVEGVRKRDIVPAAIVEAGLLGARLLTGRRPPAGIEVVRRARRDDRGRGVMRDRRDCDGREEHAKHGTDGLRQDTLPIGQANLSY